MKGPTEKHFDGIYANPRLMHAIGQVVGCIVLVQVKSGSLFEGVLKTISNRADFVLEMARKIENMKSLNSDVSAVALISNEDKIFDKLVFKVDDVVTINASNIDPEFATRENFTDTAISKFNGQVVEKELEPWDGGASSDGLPDLGGSGEEEANGWDANDMFRTNEEKYGVKSSFDSTLPGYTIPLTKQNTEEYKQQEAKASKIAQEIENSLHHRNRAALENGDEEDKYSAVQRPDNNANNFRYVSHRTRKPPIRNVRNNPPPSHVNRNSHQHAQSFHRVSSPAAAVNNSQGGYKVMNSVPTANCVNTISPRPTPTSTPPTPRQPPPAQFQQVPSPGMARATPPATPSVPVEESHKMNGEAEKAEIKYVPKPPRSLNLQTAANKEMRDSVANQQVLNKNIERRKEMDKKTPVQKARDDKTEDLKRFHARFKLSEDNKDGHEKDNISKSDTQSAVSSVSQLSSKHHNKEKNKEDDGSRKMANTPESRTSPENAKNSSLNPNAKEFVLNPNAKTFTPRVNLNNAPPAVQPRMHTQSPIMAMPQPHIMPGMAQTVFNMAPHYVVSPGSVPMTPPFPPTSSVTQPPRFRKATAMPLTLQRHDISQPVHVQAATGQPILAQPALSAAPQFAIQYAPSHGMLHPPPGPPQQLTYTQMYQLMPRVLTQPVGMVPTSAAYGDNSQIPTHVYMPHPGTPGLQHAMASAANSGQHSAPSTPQSQTPNLHPAPSPVHQPPPTGGHGQPPTPTGHHSNAPTPQPVMYSHMAQHPMHPANHSSSNQGHPFATASYPGGAQPIVLLSQQPHGPAFSSLQNHLHGQNPGHVATPTHVLQHGPLTMIPTSAGMVHTQTAISTGHYVPHTQGSVMQR